MMTVVSTVGYSDWLLVEFGSICLCRWRGNRGLSPIVFVGPEVAEYVARPQVVGEELHVFEVIQTARVCQGCVVLAVRENKLRRWCDADCVVRLIQKTPPHIPLEIFDEGREAMGTVCRMIKDFFDLSNSLLHLHIKSP